MARKRKRAALAGFIADEGGRDGVIFVLRFLRPLPDKYEVRLAFLLEEFRDDLPDRAIEDHERFLATGSYQ